MNNAVAIVGTHPGTRDKAPWNDKTCDIWIFNNQMLQGWCPRFDAVFDIHPPEDIYRRAQEHKPFENWLNTKHNIPLYTPYAIANCPDNVVYPKDKVVATLLHNFRRGKDINEYFTSGPCYALALAIYKGYKVIKFYGIEMESNSEYVYQRDGIGLWFGIAIGRGIRIEIPEESMMFYAPLYGYAMDGTKVDREAFETRAGEIQIAMDKTFTDLQTRKGELDAVLARIAELQQAKASVSEMEKIAKVYEDTAHRYEQAIANHAFLNGQYIDCRQWQSKVEKALEYSGAAQEILAENHDKIHRFMDKIDLQGASANV